jgi:hypothetical protein
MRLLELLSQAALTGGSSYPVVGDPGDWLRCAAQRQPAPHVAEAVHQRLDKRRDVIPFWDGGCFADRVSHSRSVSRESCTHGTEPSAFVATPRDRR